MDLRNLIDEAVQLAETAGKVLPNVGAGAQLAEKVLDLIDGLRTQVPDTEGAADLEAAHKQLYDEMTAKGHALSARLRG